METETAVTRPEQTITYEPAIAIDIERANHLLCLPEKGGRMQAYCMKCRAKREIKDPRRIVMKNRKPATQGVCPVSGTKVFRIGKS